MESKKNAALQKSVAAQVNSSGSSNPVAPVSKTRFSSAGLFDSSGQLISAKANIGDSVAPEIPNTAGSGASVANIPGQTLAVHAVELAIETNTDSAVQLLSALWRSPNLVHQIGTLDRISKRFKNTPVKSASDAAFGAYQLSSQGQEAYHAIAEYRTPSSRTADNVVGAYAFFVDLDVGPGKSRDGKGYETLEDARKAYQKFLAETGLPKPTHAVYSGAGVHLYWVLDSFIDRDTWIANADKLKALAHHYGFLADPSRTADIASVLRIPGTLNYKYDPPLPVTLAYSCPTYIATADMLNAIEAAFSKMPAVGATASVKPPATVVKPSSVTDVQSISPPPNFENLASALKVLTPDCDEYTWKFYRLAALARIAREHPELAARVYALTKAWASGELGGIPSKIWVTPGSDGRTGAQSFDAQWARFLKPREGSKTSVGTIYDHAKKLGWEFPGEHFPVIAEAECVGQDAGADLTPLQAVQMQFALLNMNGKLCVFNKKILATVTEKGAAQRLMLSTRTDGALLIRRAIKARYPKEKCNPVVDAFWVSAQTACYVGVDFSPTGTSDNCLNLWVGPTIVSTAGSWALIKGFLLTIICDGNQTYYIYLIGYIAHALQHPEEKPGILIILIGGQGNGKGTLARILQRVWSATFLQVSDVHAVVGNFNAALERAFIVFMDEALFAGDRRSSDALKSLVTEPVIHINEKHQPARQTSSYHRFFVATNADHLKQTDRDDRRDFSLRVSESRKGDHAYWKTLYQEINNGGVEAMVHDLLAMDLSSFNVRAKPDTAELLEQKLQSLGPIQRWWYECLVHGGMTEDEAWPDYLATLDAVADIFDLNGGKMFRKCSAIDVANALKKLCPSAAPGQKETDLGRRRGLTLPTLAIARAEFEVFIGASVA